MKIFKIAIVALFAAAFCIPCLYAQAPESSPPAASSPASNSLKGMSLNGSTGLFSIPTGRTGWEQSSSFGLDMGYHAIIDGGKASHIPKLSLSLFKWLELSGAFDVQPDGFITTGNGSDFIAGAKIHFPVSNAAIALGGNFQSLNLGNDANSYVAGQVYLAVSYAGRFFNSPAETTLVLGKTFVENKSDSNIDFGMGFDLVLLQRYLGNFVHWITDFANFSYSAEPFGADSTFRGVLNTGLRINIAAVPALSKLKLSVDVLMVDILDENRAFSAGVVFGVPIL